MKANPVKRALREGRPQVGTWLSLGSVTAARFLARSGLPWLTVDLEHSPTDLGTAALIFGAIADAGCVPLARVVDGRHDLIKQALDCGAMGIVAPMVMDPAQARSIVAATRYPPLGNRSVGGNLHALNYGATAEEYYARADAEILVVIQTEHVAAVECADETYAVPGVDAVFVGPNDLAASLRGPDGSPPSEALMESTLTRIREACGRQGVAAGLHVFSIEDARRRVAEGWKFVAVNSDLKFMHPGGRRGRESPGDGRARRRSTWRNTDGRGPGRDARHQGARAGLRPRPAPAQGLETIVVDVGSVGRPRSGPTSAATRSSGRARDIAAVERRRPGRGGGPGGRGGAGGRPDLAARGVVEGVFGLGGSAGTVIGSAAMRALPFGLPKVLVSTLASGQTRPFVGGADIALFHPVADLAGLNRLTRGPWPTRPTRWRGWSGRAGSPARKTGRPVVAATMFGVTTRLRRREPARGSKREGSRSSSSTPPGPAAGRWSA